jgi:broad specificity phosphatase PhoE
MSSLTLVRHGQATAFQRDGHLTPLGESQARSLAEFWLRHGIGFDEVQSGTLARQVQTEQTVAACFRAAGLPWPEAVRDAAWNEYDASGIGTPPAAPFGTAEYRRFQLMFQTAMLRWLDGGRAADGAEPFEAFRDRVSGAIRRVMAGPSGRRVAVFTSGGPIGFAVNFAVGGPDRSFLELNWRVQNSSLTEFVFSQERITLDGFNHIAHLEESGLRTYR